MLPLGLGFLVVASPPAGGVCDVIPGVARSFRGTVGSSDRPFASPGDFVELRLSPACDKTSQDVVLRFGERPEDQVIAIVFTPPHGPRNVAVLTSDCLPLRERLQRCSDRADVDVVTCIPSRELDPADVQVTGSPQDRRLRFRFPDTDSLVDQPDDDRTLTGPATIAVTMLDADLPCQLASESCAEQSGLLACIDQLFSIDGTCGVEPHEGFSHFTALPPPNNFQALCNAPTPPCDPRAEAGAEAEVRFTIDTAGNALIPMDWSGVLLGQGVPIARSVRGGTAVEAFPGSQASIRIPSNVFLGSFSVEGAKLPPIFDPEREPCTGTERECLAKELVLFGTADAPRGVLRVARRGPELQTCVGGTNAGLPCFADDPAGCPEGECAGGACRQGPNRGEPCEADDDCPGGECGSALFDFATRLVDDVGPVIVPRFVENAAAGVCQSDGVVCDTDDDCDGAPCVTYRAEARDPVPLDALFATDQMLVTVVPEGVNGESLNADDDARDDVVIVVDRQTGMDGPVDSSAGTAEVRGRAATRVRQLPFTFPAVAAEGDVVAFLESEPAEGYQDANGNRRVFDNILRVRRLDGTVLDPGNLAADPAPVVNGRSLAFADGLLFFRTPEVANARHRSERITVPTSFEGRSKAPQLSTDGRFVLYEICGGDAANLEVSDIVLYDRATGASTTIAQDHGNVLMSSCRRATALSADGCVVAFAAYASLQPDDQNGTEDAYVYDRCEGTLARISRSPEGEEIFWESGNGLDVSADGLHVALGHDPISGSLLIYDRQLMTMIGTEPSLPSELPGGWISGAKLSGDGRFVSLHYPSGSFRYDRQSDRFLRVDLPTGTTGAQDATGARAAVMSYDGRFHAFGAYGSGLVAGDTNNTSDVFLRDAEAETTIRVSVGFDGRQGNGVSTDPSISADGRLVAFHSDARLVASSLTGCRQGFACGRAFLHDSLTGMTMHLPDDSTIAISPGGGSTAPAISADGRYVAYRPETSEQRSGGPGTSDILVWGVDPEDLVSDVTGNGLIRETVLRVLDTASGDLSTLCPAEAVAVARAPEGGTIDGPVAAFLRPESARHARNCPEGDNDSLNGDGDADDDVVHLWSPSTGVQNLRRAAVQLSVSARFVAALVSERAQDGRDLNNDGDTEDEVVHVHRIGEAPDAWSNLQQAGDVVEVAGSYVVFITPEAAQGNRGLNRDGDATDRVLQIYDADAGRMIVGSGALLSPRAATEFVVGGTEEKEIVAFRTSEEEEGQTRLNGDSDWEDFVLQVYDRESGSILSTNQAVTPCPSEACDPRVPYRVGINTVTFLTLEDEQGDDLNGDEDNEDLVLQVFNVKQACHTGSAATSCHVLGAASTGVCTFSGRACSSDRSCGSGNCFVPPGGCIRNLHVPCTLRSDPNVEPSPGEPPDCPGRGAFCEPTRGGNGGGVCKQIVVTDEDPNRQVPCASNADCAVHDPQALCVNAGQAYTRLLAPLSALASQTKIGAKVFTSAGRCVEDLGNVCDPERPRSCRAGTACERSVAEPGAFRCVRRYGTCADDAQCPNGSVCRQDVVVATTNDADGDEVPDLFDNCPNDANPRQENRDPDSAGDLCDLDHLLPCIGDCTGDGVVAIDELVTGMNLVLDGGPPEDCPALDASRDGHVAVNELMHAVRIALTGCRGS